MTKTNESVLKEYAITKLNQKRGLKSIQVSMMANFGCTSKEAHNAIVNAKGERAKRKAEKKLGLINPEKKSCQCGSDCGCKDEVVDLEKKHSDEGDLLWMKSELAQAKTTIKGLQKRVGFENSIRGIIESSIPRISPLPLKLQKNNSDCKTVSVISHWSDWHIGEKIFANQTEDFGEFDFSIAEKRMSTYMEKFDDWVDLHKKNYNVEEWAVLCTGDMIGGRLHPELTETEEFPPPIQAVKAGELLARSIASSAHKYPKVTVHFIVGDNHGRLSIKNQSKNGGRNSWNYVVGTVAKTLLEKYKNVTFNVYESLQEVIQVQNRKYLIMHGHMVRGGSVPYQSIQKRIGRESYARMNMDDGKKFHAIVMGHYHVPMKCQDLIMAGSLGGTSEFDHAVGRHCDPIQTAWFCSPKWEFDFIEFHLV